MGHFSSAFSGRGGSVVTWVVATDGRNDSGGRTHGLRELSWLGFLLRGRNLVEGIFVCACQIDGCLHDSLSTFGYCTEAAAEVSDDVKAVTGEVFVDDVDGTPLKGADVCLFDD